MSILQTVLFFLLFGALMGLIARSRRGSRPGYQTRILKLPFSILILSLVCLAMFGALALYVNLMPNQTSNWLTTTIFLIGMLLGLLLLEMYIVSRHTISDGSLNYGTIFGKHKIVAWSEMLEINYQPRMKWFKITTQSAGTIYISAMLQGLPEFAKLVRQKAGQAKVDAATQVILSDTAAGKLPSLWD